MSDTLHPDDSLFHPAGNDPWAYESYWFSFFVPDRKLMVYVYPWFRPNLGIAAGGVSAWDHTAADPWTIVHCDYHWHLPCPTAAEMIDGNTLTLPQGVRITVLEPLMSFASAIRTRSCRSTCASTRSIPPSLRRVRSATRSCMVVGSTSADA
jgi:hypothetical protein